MSKEKLKVIKIGGAVIENEQMLEAFLADFQKVKGHKLLVHGGGRIATEIGNKQGIKANMVEGRRVTDDATIDLVTMVYGGLVNKKMIATLQAMGINAIGMTGADGGIIRSVKRPIKDGVDYGWVGDPKEVNAKILAQLLEAGLTPIIAPLTHDGNGKILNTNADTMAGTVAVALADYFEVELSLTFELEGVMKDINDPNSLIPTFRQDYFEKMKGSGAIHSGMIPKLENAFYALGNGVKDVRICKFDQIHSKNGTFLQL